MSMTGSDVERFWRKVRKSNGCWEWQAARFTAGHGAFRLRPHDGKQRLARAHRIAWELTHGAIPDGRVVCHRCDNPPCVRPDHLFLGTQAENLADMRAKGRLGKNRGRPGEQHSQARLTRSDVVEMRRLRREGASFASLARRFGVGRATANRAVRGESWAHVPGAVTDGRVRPNFRCSRCGHEAPLGDHTHNGRVAAAKEETNQ